METKEKSKSENVKEVRKVKNTKAEKVTTAKSTNRFKRKPLL
ncbi:hypothetical protein AB6735_02230 [Mucilaginibacter sp. RCC_168]|jgi:hypothetical protein